MGLMISVLLSWIILIFLFKDISFMSSYFFLEKNFMFLFSIFPVVALLIFMFSFNHISSFSKDNYNFKFFLIFLFLYFSFSSSFSIMFLVFLESCVMLMILLIFNLSKDLDKVSSTFFMFLINILGSIPFMFFCVNKSNWLFSLEIFYSSMNSFVLLISLLILLVSKMPIFFFHFWLTKAHVSASGSGSMILASLMLKIGTFGLYKFQFLFNFFSNSLMYFTSLSLCLFSCIFISSVMNRYFDIKYLVACSSIVHMAFIFPSFLSFQGVGVLSSVLMMVSHGVISCFIFFLVTLIYESSLNRSLFCSSNMESFNKNFCLFLFFFFLMNLSFPPFLSFVSEFFLICFLLKTDIYLLILFFLSLLLLGKIFIFLCLTFLFGKKSKTSLDNYDLSTSVFSFIYFFFFSFLFVYCF